MGLLVIIPFAMLGGWCIVKIFQRIRHGGYGREWWRAFKLLAVGGMALGIYFAFFMQYQAPNNRLKGFPIPVEISTREKPEGPWLTSAMPAVVRLGAIVTDLLSGVALCLAPLALAAFFRDHRAGLRDAAGNPANRGPA